MLLLLVVKLCQDRVDVLERPLLVNLQPFPHFKVENLLVWILPGRLHEAEAPGPSGHLPPPPEPGLLVTAVQELHSASVFHCSALEILASRCFDEIFLQYNIVNEERWFSFIKTSFFIITLVNYLCFYEKSVTYTGSRMTGRIVGKIQNDLCFKTFISYPLYSMLHRLPRFQTRY